MNRHTMSSEETVQSLAAILDELGFQRYEARCFVALTRLSDATAREISDAADVPRTRVYDAVDQLEREGFVDIQHSNPQRFRAISVDQAVTLLRERFGRRFDRLHDGLESLDGVGTQRTTPTAVWTTIGQASTEARTIEFIDAAAEEVICIVNDGETTSERLLTRLQAASDRGVSVLVGTLTEEAAKRVREAVPDAQLLDGEISWLEAPDSDHPPAAVLGRIVIADREAVLLSSLSQHDGEFEEHALWCDDIGNGLVLIVRRLLLAGLDSTDTAS